MGLIDLHIHSTYSDGTLSPCTIVDLAKKTGVQAIAITDHDTVAGVAEARVHGRKTGVEVIPGIEISSWLDNIPLHILGYRFRYKDNNLQQRLHSLQKGRRIRNEKILAKLNHLGIDLTMAELTAFSEHGQAGRPHIAQLLVNRGAVPTMEQAFKRYLRRGAAAYAERFKYYADEAITMIRGINDNGILQIALFLQHLDHDFGINRFHIPKYVRDRNACNVLKKVADVGAKKVVFTCPSCFHTWRHMYGTDIELMHSSQLINALIKDGRIKLNKEINIRTTYHDPCDLGRNTGVYEEPREVLKAIPGIDFVELPMNRKFSICCGGGGNVEMTDPELSAQVAQMKLDSIKDVGAEMVITACQQCVRTMTTRAKRTKTEIVVKDLTELIVDAME